LLARATRKPIKAESRVSESPKRRYRVEREIAGIIEMNSQRRSEESTPAERLWREFVRHGRDGGGEEARYF
jgi:hypothetical protein